VAGEFLGEQGIAFDRLDIHDGGEGTRRWQEAGRPIVPSLLAGGVATPILHVSQLAAALGLPSPPAQASTRLAWETLPLLRSWLDRVRGLDEALLVRPTASRGRTLLNLTVNVFHPFELLPGAWRELDFPWQPERDDERERALGGAGGVLAYAGHVFADWTSFVLESGDELGGRDPVVTSPRGEVTYSVLLDSQVEHVSFHHAQLDDFLQEAGRE
jgi:hypothetical protein